MQTSKRRNRFIAILLVMAFICSLWGRKGLGFVSADEEVATATDATEAGADSGSGALSGGTVATTTDAVSLKKARYWTSARKITTHQSLIQSWSLISW